MNWLKKLFGSQKSLPARELPDHDDKGGLVLALIVGHDAKDQGAIMHESRESEYQYNSKLAEMVKELAQKHWPLISVGVVYRDKVGLTGAYKLANEKFQADLAIELHFNAADGKAKGTTTLCTPDLNDVEFAHCVQKEMARVFMRKQNEDRGVRTISRTARGGENVHSFPGGSNCLVEPFFGDNPEDAAAGRSLMRPYAEGLLKAVELYGRKIDLIK